MKLSQLVQAGARLRVKGGRGRLVKADVVWDGLLKHLHADLQMDKTSGGGYTPTKEVLGNRERHRQYIDLGVMGKDVRPDAWIEHDGQKGADVGFRDNRDPVKYNEAIEKYAAVAKKAGYKPNLKKGKPAKPAVGLKKPRPPGRHSLAIGFDEKKIKAAEAAHGKYLAELKKKGHGGGK